MSEATYPENFEELEQETLGGGFLFLLSLTFLEENEFLTLEK
jgi:hypothetical protein